MDKLLSVGRFLRILDEDNQLSLTNIFVMVVIAKVILKQNAISTTDLGTVLAAVVGYQGKRAVKTKKEVEVIKANKIHQLKLSEIFHRGDMASAPKQVLSNSRVLLTRVNKLLGMLELDAPVEVSSGYRDADYNVKIGGARRSSHVLGMAVDLRDVDNRLKPLITEEMLIECELFMESPIHTPTWLHLQTRPTNSRIFLP